MKLKYILLIIAATLFNVLSDAQTKTKNTELEEFVSDFSSANVKLRGKLLQMGAYKGDLSRLTFDQYLILLKENESVSNKGLSEMVKKSDKFLFVARKNTFVVALYLKSLDAVVSDDANSSFLDLIQQIGPDGKIPSLKDCIAKAESRAKSAN